MFLGGKKKWVQQLLSPGWLSCATNSVKSQNIYNNTLKE
jgi:hypothetical protein